jgi:hypothetical protein
VDVPKQEGKTLRVGARESFKAARGPTGRVQALWIVPKAGRERTDRAQALWIVPEAGRERTGAPLLRIEGARRGITAIAGIKVCPLREPVGGVKAV